MTQGRKTTKKEKLTGRPKRGRPHLLKGKRSRGRATTGRKEVNDAFWKKERGAATHRGEEKMPPPKKEKKRHETIVGRAKD